MQTKKNNGRIKKPIYVLTALIITLLFGSITVCAADKKEDDKPDVKIEITNPEEEWLKDNFETTVTVTLPKKPEIEIKSVTAKLGYSGELKDITNDMKYTIANNGTLYITVKDTEGNTYGQEFEINYFDKEGPELIGAINEGVLTISVSDNKSGINSLIVNGYEYTDCPNGTLAIRLQQFDASYKEFSIFVTDKVGNYSEEYIVTNPYYQEDAEKEDNDEDLSAYLPINAEGSPITSATGTVTTHATEYGYTNGPGEVLDVSGNHVADYDGMEFYIIQTESGKTFYMVIDKSQSDHNAYLLTESDEADLLNFTGTETVVLPQNGAVIAGTYQGTGEEGEEVVTKGGTFNSSPTAVGNEEGESEEQPAKPKNNNMVMIIILVAIGGGAVLFMKMKNKKKKKHEEEIPVDIKDDDDGEEETEEAD